MIKIDEAAGWVEDDANGVLQRYPIGSPAAFAAISRGWLRSGWDAKYVYSFSWLGRPVIQLPEDLLRIQEVVYRVKPTVIIETGIAHGGSLVFFASLFKATGISGRVIGVDLEIRPHNRSAIEAHELFPFITLVEGNAIDAGVVARVRDMVRPEDRVLVVLDSNHTKAHVLAELENYGPLVSPGSFIVATDGIMGWLGNAPRTQPDWSWNNPRNAADEFLESHPEFERVALEPPFNEGTIVEPVTYWPGAWLRRRDA